MSVTATKENGPGAAVPETPKSLMYLALLFVPGVYLVLVFSAALVVGVGGGLILLGVDLMKESGRVYGKLVVLLIMLALGVLVGLWAVIKGVGSAIWRKPGFQPALLVNLAAEPRLRDFIGKICWPMGSMLPTSVILHAEPRAFVTQAQVRVFNGMAKGRVLCIGLPLLGALTVNELRAVLAHEFGHFTGNDTVYSARVQPVYAGAVTAYREMHEAIAQNAANDGSFWTRLPMFVPRFFLYIYLNIFHNLNMRISRQMEQRADVLAVTNSGTQSFVNGLKKIVGLSGVYHESAVPELMNAIKQNKTEENFFGTFRGALPGYVQPAKGFVDEAMAEVEDPGDSHPTLKTRLSYIPDVPEKFEDRDIATSLFANLESYEKDVSEAFVALLAMVQRHNDALEAARA